VPDVSPGICHDYVFLPRARRDYNALLPRARVEIDQLVQQLCADPAVDGVRIVDLPMPPAVLRRCDDGRWSITYTVVAPFVLQLRSIAPSRRD
jgi:hypothetical protein